MTRRRHLLIAVALVTSLAAAGARAAPTPQEQSKVDKLIAFVASHKDLKFIRNGTEHDSSDAAKFLRGKLESMGGEITSAREFIERIATRSSMSGEAYQVKFADGRTMPAAQFLREELTRIEARPA